MTEPLDLDAIRARLGLVTRSTWWLDTMEGNRRPVVAQLFRTDLPALLDALDEARAKAVDGGEWQWGVRYASPDNAHETWDDWTERKTRDFVTRYNNINSRLSKATLIRRRVGPIEPVTDDGSATDG